jgi:hypothetical protein
MPSLGKVARSERERREKREKRVSLPRPGKVGFRVFRVFRVLSRSHSPLMRSSAVFFPALLRLTLCNRYNLWINV